MLALADAQFVTEATLLYVNCIMVNLRYAETFTNSGLTRLLWPPYVIGGALYFCPVISIYLSIYLSIYFYLFSSPNLSGSRLDVYQTLTHGVALVRIWNAGLKCVACGSLQIRDAKKSPKIAIWAPSHKFVSYIFATTAHIDSRKNVLSSNISSTCPHNMLKFGPLAAEIVSLVWGTLGNFNGFRVLAALLHGTLVVGVSQTAALNRGRHLYSAGRPSPWAWPIFLVLFFFVATRRQSQLFSIPVGRRKFLTHERQ